MSRLKIKLPSHFSFTCSLATRITDINYGGHAGNDTILSMIHEARMQYLQHLGYSEMEFEGNGLIMADASIEYKNELFYGDIVFISVTAGEVSKIGFELFYKMEKKEGDKTFPVAYARTGMICYNYDRKKIVPLAEEARKKLTA